MSTATSSRREEIRSRRGHDLAGLAVRPTGSELSPWTLFSHCFTCGKDLKGYHTLCRNLAVEGWASLRLDFTGLGKSGGVFGDTDLDSNVADLEDAAAHLAAFHAPPRLLIGHSLGGAAALLAAPRLPSLRGLVLLGTPSDLDHLPEAVPAIRTAAERGRPIATILGGQRVEVGPGLLPNLVRCDLRAALADLYLPLLILHAPRDEVVPFAHAERLTRWAGPRATLIPLDAADHLLTSPDQAAGAAREIAAWALPFFDAS